MVPVTLAPVLVIFITSLTPPTLKSIVPPADGISIFEVPFVILGLIVPGVVPSAPNMLSTFPEPAFSTMLPSTMLDPLRYMSLNLALLEPKSLVALPSGIIFEPTVPVIISWSPMVTSCVIVRLFPTDRSPVALILPVNSLTEPAKFTTLALPAMLIVTLALFATLTFDVPLAINVGSIVEPYNSAKLSLHFI